MNLHDNQVAAMLRKFGVPFGPLRRRLQRTSPYRTRRPGVMELQLESRLLLAGTYSLLKDVLPNPTRDGSEPREFVQVGNTTFFTANSEATGVELWKSDGTADGTVLVRDINSGVGSSDPQYLTNVSGTLFFAANDGVNGSELWKSDGTPEGTVMVRDIRPGPGLVGTPDADGGASSDPASLVNHNGVLYFAANDGIHGRELWKSDGTESGTLLVSDIADGDYYGTPMESDPRSLTSVANTLFFIAQDNASGFELWKSDGTDSGTVLVRDINPGGFSSFVTHLTEAGGSLLFVADDGTHGSEIWTSDGTTAGTTMLKDIAAGSASSFPTGLINVAGTIFFAADSSSYGTELWRSDGTPSGTVLVSDINSGAGSSYPQYLTNVSGTLFFAANDGVFGNELFRSDGTAAGTFRVKNINTGGALADSDPSGLVNVDGTLFFQAYEKTTGAELWKSDGSESGTVLVRDINPSTTDVNGTAYPNGSAPYFLFNAGGTLLFAADDGLTGRELWVSDGSESGTARLADINTRGSEPDEFVDLNGTLIFTAKTGEEYSTDDITVFTAPVEELYASDGTTAGTILLHDFEGAGTYLKDLTRFGNQVFFSVYTETYGTEVWKTDGTPSGTQLLKDIAPGKSFANPDQLTVVGDSLFFTTNRNNLWKSDGTEAGTVHVKDLTPTNISFSDPDQLTNVNGTLYFTAYDDAHGIEIWKSDGTSAGTVRVSDIIPGTSPFWRSDGPRDLFNFNGTLVFSAIDANEDRELWKSDGTQGGTVRVRDIRPGFYFGSSSPTAFTNHNGELFFFALGADGHGLWKSDGTEAGTVSVKGDSDLTVSHSFEIESIGDSVVFTFGDSDYGSELWTTDGTPGGTALLKDIRPGAGRANPKNLRNLNGTLYFTANDGVTGERLWVSDGTSSGTTVLTSGGAPQGVDPGPVLQAADTVFFSAISAVHGRELFIVDPEVTDPPGSAPTVTGPSSRTAAMRPEITWTAVDGASEYEIWVGNQSTGVNPFHQATVSGTTYTPHVDFGIGRFNLWIRAKNSAGNGPWTSQYNFAVTTGAAIQDPGRYLNTHRPTLTWGALPGAVAYDLWINDELGGISQFVREPRLTETSWTPATDMPLGLYHAWVRGIAADGSASDWSFRIIFYVMPAPTVSAGRNPTFDRTPEFAWNALLGAVKYEVFIRNRNTGGTTLYQQNITDLSFTPASELADGPYLVWIIAVSGVNVRSYWTAPMDIFIGGRTDVLSPSGTTNDTTPQFTWRTVDGATRYDLWVDQVGGRGQIIREQNLSETTFVPATPLPTGNYRVWVRAISTAGEVGFWSLTVSFSIAASAVPDVDSVHSAFDMCLIAGLPADPTEASIEIQAENSLSTRRASVTGNPTSVAAAATDGAQPASAHDGPRFLREGRSVSEQARRSSDRYDPLDLVFEWLADGHTLIAGRDGDRAPTVLSQP